ncbi:MAG TPA: RNA polymerase sigma factor SigZ [Arenibaculum sp.]|nr:RNA polymerase sigma factor SigZ [Arenibaculum sp.]
MTSLHDVWSRFGQSLLGFIRRRVRSAEDAEEIFQDVMLRVHRGIGNLSDAEKIQPWLYRIARNAIIDHYRAAAARPVSEELPDELPEPEDDDASLNREIEGCLAPMVNQLEGKYREAVHMADFEGIAQQEVADRLGISLSGAKSRIQRGREMLRGELQRCCRLTLDGSGNVIDYEPTGRGPAC